MAPVGKQYKLAQEWLPRNKNKKIVSWGEGKEATETNDDDDDDDREEWEKTEPLCLSQVQIQYRLRVYRYLMKYLLSRDIGV